MTLNYEERMSRAYDRAWFKYGDSFDEASPEERHWLAYPFYMDICHEEEAAYWQPLVESLEEEQRDEWERQEATRRLNGF